MRMSDPKGICGGGSMKVRVFGPPSWAMEGIRELDVHVAGRCTAREMLNQLVAAYPGLKEKIFREGQALQRGVNLFVRNCSIRVLEGLNTTLEEEDELILFPLLCGG
jgi:molybdopterin synthase sulfur carrier subunit